MAKDDVLREDDGPEDGDAGEQQRQPNGDATGLANQRSDTVLRPVGDAPIRLGADRKAEKPEFEIVEVDENDQPVGGGAAPEDDNREGGRLSEEESGERPYLETQAREEAGERTTGRREKPSERRARKKKYLEKVRDENGELRRAVDSMRAELEDLRNGTAQRLSQYDATRVQSELAGMDRDIEKHANTIRAAESKQREAMSNNDPDAFIAAQTAREEAFVAKVKLENKKEVLQSRIDAANKQGGGPDQTEQIVQPRQPNGNGQQQRQRPLGRQAERYVDEFKRTHDWLDANSRDPEVRRDSRRVLYLDREIHEEGYDENTQEYWDELESRMREVMPYVFDDDDDPAPRTRQNGAAKRGAAVNGNGADHGQRQQQPQNQQRRGPVVADVGGRGASNARNKTQVKVTPERKKALIDTGSLSPDGRVIDRVKFERQLARFAEYDAQVAPR